MNKEKIGLQELTAQTDDTAFNFSNDHIDDSTQDQIALLAVSELLDIKKLKTISRINPDQITNITKLYMFADTFKTSFARKLADTVLQLQISTNGLGRKELVQLVQQRIGGYIIPDTTTKKGIFK